MLILLSAWKRFLPLENVALYILGHFWQHYIIFVVVSIAHFVGQSDSVLTLRWPKELLQFQLARLFSSSFPRLLGHLANFIQLPCSIQKMGTFCWEQSVSSLHTVYFTFKEFLSQDVLRHFMVLIRKLSFLFIYF